MVQDPSHGVRQRAIDAGEQRVLSAVGGRDDVGTHEPADEIVARCLCDCGASDQTREVGKPAVGGDRSAAGAAGRRGGKRLRACPGKHLLGRAIESGSTLQIAAQATQLFEQWQCLDQLVGMEIIHACDRYLDRAFVTERDDDAGGEAGDGIVEIVYIDAQWLAARERLARLDRSAAGAAGKVAKNCKTKNAAGSGRRSLWKLTEADLVAHDGGS